MNTSSTASDRFPAPRRPSRSLRFHLALGFGLLVLVLIGAIVVTLGEFASDLARKSIGRQLTRLAIEMRDKLDVGVFERMTEIEMLARADSALTGAPRQTLREVMINELHRSTPDYSWLAYVDAKGQVLHALRGLLVGQDVSTRPWFQHGLVEPHVGDVRDATLLAKLIPHVDGVLPRFIDIALPLRDASGTYGVVAGHVNWSWAARLRDSIESYAQPDAPFELLVLSAQGEVLVGPKALVGTSVRMAELDPAHLRAYDARIETWADGVNYLTGTSATRGHAGFAGLGWVVVARQRADLAFAPVRELQTRIAMAGVLLALAAIALGWWLATRVSGPLFRISTAADAISRGQRRVQIPSGGGFAESERLAVSLRAMLASLNEQEEDLRQAQERLEARVRERTAELAKARAEVELESAEHALASEEAAAAKQQLSLALEASKLALWDYDVAIGRVYMSESWSRMLGAGDKAVTTTIEALFELVPEEDRKGVMQAVGAAIRGPLPTYRVEHRVNRPDGKAIWIVSEGRVVSRDLQGRAIRIIGTNRNVSERVGSEQALRESEDRFRRLTHLYSDWYWELDADLRFTRIEGAGLAKLGIRAEEVIGGTSAQFPRYELTSMTTQAFAQLRAQRKSYRDVRGRFSMPDGSYCYVSITGEPVFDTGGKFLGYRGVTRDITEQVHAEAALAESEERFKGAFENSATGMALIALDGRWLKVNRAVCDITGYSEAELLARSYQELTHPEDRNAGPASLAELLAGKKDSVQIEKRYVHKLGHSVWVLVNVSLVRDGSGKPRHFISQTLDISERKRLLQRVEHLALHDPLTGLPNSRLLLDRLELAVASARRAKRSMGVMYVDLDEFKQVNDTHGHAAGDLVLKEFALRIRKVLRETDSVARVGGDEFIVILGETSGESESAAAATRLLAAVAVPFDIGGAQVQLSASIGIALFPGHGADAQTLMQHADEAMYCAKRAGRNSYRFFAGDEK